MAAFRLCRQTIAGYALDPANAKIPYKRPSISPQEYSFAWGRESGGIRMRNAFGAEMPASASCVVDRETERIVILTVNGKTII